MRNPLRWGPFLYLLPNRYVEPRYIEHFPQWSNRYNWREDEGWWLFGDWIQEPDETFEKEAGDCEDYALVAVAWGLDRDRNMRLAWLWEGWNPPHPTHVVAYDDGYVYSSGTIFRGSMEDFIEDSEYTHYVDRNL